MSLRHFACDFDPPRRRPPRPTRSRTRCPARPAGPLGFASTLPDGAWLRRLRPWGPAVLALALAAAALPAGAVETATLASLAVVRGTVDAGDIGSLVADDDVALAVTSAAPTSGKGKKKHGIEWSCATTVSDDTVALRITFAGSASMKVKQTIYIYRWKNGKWKPVQNSQVTAGGIVRTTTVDSAFHYVSTAGEVRLRVLVEGKKVPFTHASDLLQVEVLPAGITGGAKAAAGAGSGAEPRLVVVGGPVVCGGVVRFAARADVGTGLALYDARGRRLLHLAPSAEADGERAYTWDGRDARGTRVPRGVYFARAELRSGARTQRFVWLLD